MSAEFDWQAAYRKEHADLCHVEAVNYVLRAALHHIVGWSIDHDEARDIARKALGEPDAKKT